MGAVRSFEESKTEAKRDPELEAGTEPGVEAAPKPATWDPPAAPAPEPEAETAPQPTWSPAVWAPEVNQKAKPKYRRDASVVEPPPIPDWHSSSPLRSPPLRSTPQQRREQSNEKPTANGLVHPRPARPTGPPPRRRVLVTTLILAGLVALLVAAVATVYALQPTTPNPGLQTPSASDVPPSLQASQVQVRAATAAAVSATTTVRSRLAAMSGFPTPPKVAAMINPYDSSLQLYEVVLSVSAVPAAVWSAKSGAAAQVRRDLQFLATINGLPPVRLGAYLRQLGTNSTQLQATLNTFEQTLR